VSKKQTARLGEILVSLGYSHTEQIDEALELQKIRPKRIGEILMDLGYNEEDHILEALSEQFDIPFERSLRDQIDSALTTKVPIGFIREYQMFPFRQNGTAFYVALNDPVNQFPLDDLRLLLDGPVQPVLCRKADIDHVTDTYFERQGDTASQMIDGILLSGDDGDDLAPTLDALDSHRDLMDLANEAPIIKLINLLITGAVKERASDIHVEPFERELRVRYRIDGVLYEKFSVPKSQQAAVVSRIKIMANMNIAEHRLPQDGRIKIRLSGKEIDIRVSIIPVAFGERVVMRILEKGTFLFGLEELGMVKHDYQLVDKLIQSSHGILLVTGPTGSGKSTTLYAALQRVNSPDKNIITVEDPIEYQMPSIGQIQVRPKIGLTFAAGLRSILRQDPDVILVGEIRDMETAEMAIQASLTGHLVFSTLHTNDSAGAITRSGEHGHRAVPRELVHHRHHGAAPRAADLSPVPRTLRARPREHGGAWPAAGGNRGEAGVPRAGLRRLPGPRLLRPDGHLRAPRDDPADPGPHVEGRGLERDQARGQETRHAHPARGRRLQGARGRVNDRRGASRYAG
jgi:general secretion pathway protein E